MRKSEGKKTYFQIFFIFFGRIEK